MDNHNPQQEFPLDYYLGTLVRLLDVVEYEDRNYTHKERISSLRYAYAKAADHFSQPHVVDTLKVPPNMLAAALKTIVGMVCFAWVKVSPQLQADLSIHYTYTLLLDDSREEPAPSMANWYGDLLQGNEQKHGWWRLVNDEFPNLLQHYGGYCQMNLVRSTIDFFQGCWIEQYNFKGYPGSHDYPGFLRRLNGLGHCVGASLWPASQFDEQRLFLEITTAIAQMENWMVWVNDLFSFYKEFDGDRDQTSLVQNYCATEGISISEALDKLCTDTTRSSKQIMSVFSGKDPAMVETLRCFIQGYITWHLCDDRYRLRKVYEKAGDSAAAAKFYSYMACAREVGVVDPREYAVPSVTQLTEEKAAAAANVGPAAAADLGHVTARLDDFGSA